MSRTFKIEFVDEKRLCQVRNLYEKFIDDIMVMGIRDITFSVKYEKEDNNTRLPPAHRTISGEKLG